MMRVTGIGLGAGAADDAAPAAATGATSPPAVQRPAVPIAGTGTTHRLAPLVPAEEKAAPHPSAMDGRAATQPRAYGRDSLAASRTAAVSGGATDTANANPPAFPSILRQYQQRSSSKASAEAPPSSRFDVGSAESAAENDEAAQSGRRVAAPRGGLQGDGDGDEADEEAKTAEPVAAASEMSSPPGGFPDHARRAATPAAQLSFAAAAAGNMAAATARRGAGGPPIVPLQFDGRQKKQRPQSASSAQVAASSSSALPSRDVGQSHARANAAAAAGATPNSNLKAEICAALRAFEDKDMGKLLRVLSFEQRPLDNDDLKHLSAAEAAAVRPLMRAAEVNHKRRRQEVLATGILEAAVGAHAKDSDTLYWCSLCPCRKPSRRGAITSHILRLHIPPVHAQADAAAEAQGARAAPRATPSFSSSSSAAAAAATSAAFAASPTAHPTAVGHPARQPPRTPTSGFLVSGKRTRTPSRLVLRAAAEGADSEDLRRADMEEDEPHSEEQNGSSNEEQPQSAAAASTAAAAAAAAAGPSAGSLPPPVAVGQAPDLLARARALGFREQPVSLFVRDALLTTHIMSHHKSHFPTRAQQQAVKTFLRCMQRSAKDVDLLASGGRMAAADADLSGLEFLAENSTVYYCHCGQMPCCDITTTLAHILQAHCANPPHAVPAAADRGGAKGPHRQHKRKRQRSPSESEEEKEEHSAPDAEQSDSDAHSDGDSRRLRSVKNQTIGQRRSGRSRRQNSGGYGAGGDDGIVDEESGDNDCQADDAAHDDFSSSRAGRRLDPDDSAQPVPTALVAFHGRPPILSPNEQRNYMRQLHYVPSEPTADEWDFLLDWDELVENEHLVLGRIVCQRVPDERQSARREAAKKLRGVSGLNEPLTGRPLFSCKRDTKQFKSLKDTESLLRHILWECSHPIHTDDAATAGSAAAASHSQAARRGMGPAPFAVTTRSQPEHKRRRAGSSSDEDESAEVRRPGPSAGFYSSPAASLAYHTQRKHRSSSRSRPAMEPQSSLLPSSAFAGPRIHTDRHAFTGAPSHNPEAQANRTGRSGTTVAPGPDSFGGFGADADSDSGANGDVGGADVSRGARGVEGRRTESPLPAAATFFPPTGGSANPSRKRSSTDALKRPLEPKRRKKTLQAVGTREAATARDSADDPRLLEEEAHGGREDHDEGAVQSGAWLEDLADGADAGDDDGDGEADRSDPEAHGDGESQRPDHEQPLHLPAVPKASADDVDTAADGDAAVPMEEDSRPAPLQLHSPPARSLSSTGAADQSAAAVDKADGEAEGEADADADADAATCKSAIAGANPHAHRGGSRTRAADDDGDVEMSGSEGEGAAADHDDESAGAEGAAEAERGEHRATHPSSHGVGALANAASAAAASPSPPAPYPFALHTHSGRPVFSAPPPAASAADESAAELEPAAGASDPTSADATPAAAAAAASSLSAAADRPVQLVVRAAEGAAAREPAAAPALMAGSHPPVPHADATAAVTSAVAAVVAPIAALAQTVLSEMTAQRLHERETARAQRELRQMELALQRDAQERMQQQFEFQQKLQQQQLDVFTQLLQLQQRNPLRAEHVACMGSASDGQSASAASGSASAVPASTPLHPLAPPPGAAAAASLGALGGGVDLDAGAESAFSTSAMSSNRSGPLSSSHSAPSALSASPSLAPPPSAHAPRGHDHEAAAVRGHMHPDPSGPAGASAHARPSLSPHAHAHAHPMPGPHSAMGGMCVAPAASGRDVSVDLGGEELKEEPAATGAGPVNGSGPAPPAPPRPLHQQPSPAASETGGAELPAAAAALAPARRDPTTAAGLRDPSGWAASVAKAARESRKADWDLAQ